MDYRLERIEGIREVPKDALNISKLLNFDEEVIKIAENILKEGDRNEK
ncbi:hypothetical protein [Caloramator sp. Dgby_cultured_2]|nr:hypothetical protein [Caloramator sp. Dgby_cultured_2]WDU83683.1 hypothetical protein PWK10_03620 [Caloramator sp. Dgby_cultured_2]